MFRNVSLEDLNKMAENTLFSHLQINITEVGEDHVEAVMPVGPQVHQPMGFLHGGATLALAESVGSIASFLLVDPEAYHVFGMEINANHIRSMKEGQLRARAEIIHKGKTSHVWDIRAYDEEDRLISIIRMTNAVVHVRK